MDATKDWLKDLKKRYSGKEISPTELNKRLEHFEKKYSNTIAIKTSEDFTNESEKLDKIEYDVIVEQLSEIPDWKKGHELFKRGVLRGENTKKLLEIIKNNVWVVVALLLIIAILKYIFS